MGLIELEEKSVVSYLSALGHGCGCYLSEVTVLGLYLLGQLNE